MKTNRTKNTIYNFISGMFGQVLTMIMEFIVRTIFIQTLGKELLGINGLFANVVQMLSLAELGVGTAILYKLYEPLAKKDEERTRILLNFYKKVYYIIGIVVLVIGIILIPFLPDIISDYDSLKGLGINAILIYLLFISKSLVSYFFFAYKSSIIRADQKEYKINIVSYFTEIGTAVLQIIILLVFKNYIFYVILAILKIIIQNIINAILANKMYTYINKKTNNKLSKKEVKEILKDCYALFLYKINAVVLKATDNIVISAYLGLGMVALYSNYYILYNAINLVLSKIFESVVHSLGNLHTTHDFNHEHKIMRIVNFIAVMLGSLFGIGIMCVSNEFINAWIGSKWIISGTFSILMGIEVYTLSIRCYLSRYRTAMGLFQKAKYRPLIGMIINIIISILLVKKLGISGVLIGTIVADWATVVWYDPLIIYRYGLENKFSVVKYYIRNLKYLIIAFLIGIGCYMFCINLFTNLGWLSVIIHAMFCGIVVPVGFMLVFYNQEEVEGIFNIILKRKLKK